MNTPLEQNDHLTECITWDINILNVNFFSSSDFYFYLKTHCIPLTSYSELEVTLVPNTMT